MIFNIPLARNLGLVLNAQHPYSLHVGGLDVILQVPYESVTIVEAGPGGVSSMQFTIDDPDSSFEIPDDAEVRMWDYVRDLPMFLGFVERVDPLPWAAVGRTLQVSCYGIESLLDTVIVTELVYNNTGPFIHGSDTSSIAFWTQALLQVLVGLTGLRGGVNGRWNPFVNAQIGPSTLDNPIGGVSSAVDAGGITADGADMAQDFISVDLGGKTIRGALEAWRAVSISASASDTGFMPRPYALTVDFWGGVRFFEYGDGVAAFLPSDYVGITLNDTAGGAVAASDISWSRDTSPGAIVNAVFVKGAAPASTGWVVGDTTTGRRREGYVATTGTTLDAKMSAAATILNTMGAPAGRGSLRLEDFTPVNAHPTSPIVITDAQLGWTSKQMSVTQIEKTLVPGSSYQNWTVSFGEAEVGGVAGPPSLGRRHRTITRGILN